MIIAQREAWDIIHPGNVDIVHGRANSVSLKRVFPQPSRTLRRHRHMIPLCRDVDLLTVKGRMGRMLALQSQQ